VSIDTSVKVSSRGSSHGPSCRLAIEDGSAPISSASRLRSHTLPPGQPHPYRFSDFGGPRGRARRSGWRSSQGSTEHVLSDVKVNHHLIIECMRSCIGSLSNTFRNLAKRAAESRGVAKLAQVSAGVSSRGHPSYGIGKNLRLHVTVCYQTGFSRVTFSLGTPHPR